VLEVVEAILEVEVEATVGVEEVEATVEIAGEKVITTAVSLIENEVEVEVVVEVGSRG